MADDDLASVIESQSAELRIMGEWVRERLPGRAMFGAELSFDEPHNLSHGVCKSTSMFFNDVGYSHAWWQYDQHLERMQFIGAFICRRYRWSRLEFAVFRTASDDVMFVRDRGGDASRAWYRGRCIGELASHWPHRRGRFVQGGKLLGRFRLPWLHGRCHDVPLRIALESGVRLEALVQQRMGKDAAVGVSEVLGEALSQGLYAHDWFPGRVAPWPVRPIFGEADLDRLRRCTPDERILIVALAAWLLAYFNPSLTS